MEMNIFRYCSDDFCYLILDCGGRPPDPRQADLLACRSLTISSDGLILGPTSGQPPYSFQVRDLNGKPLPPDARAEEAFDCFLRDAGYLPAGDGCQPWKDSGLPGSIRRLLSL